MQRLKNWLKRWWDRIFPPAPRPAIEWRSSGSPVSAMYRNRMDDMVSPRKSPEEIVEDVRPKTDLYGQYFHEGTEYGPLLHLEAPKFDNRDYIQHMVEFLNEQ
jgi:hypothetical protein